MKLAEALVNRSDCQKRVEQLRQRLIRSAKVQEGEAPPENPTNLLAELDRALEELTKLVRNINRTNSTTLFRAGATLSDALAERDMLMLKRSVLNSLIEAAATQQMRFGRSEIKLLEQFSVRFTHHERHPLPCAWA